MGKQQRTHFLWPDSQPLGGADWLGRAPSSQDVERKLAGIFPGNFPVLFSSARAGLSAVVLAEGWGRADLVWMPGFSSHCVIDSIGYFATPSPLLAPEVKAALTYHQWGWVHEVGFEAHISLIEDAVDTLFRPGGSVFQTRANHVLWSLPKVLSSVGGGVVFCREAQQANKLIEVRAVRKPSLLQAGLRLASGFSEIAHAYWNGAESLQGELPPVLRSQVLRLLDGYAAMHKSREMLFEEFFPEFWESEWAASGKLPSNVPLTVPHNWAAFWGTEGRFSAGLRSFNVARQWPASAWKKVAPLAMHQDMGREELKFLSRQLNLKIEKHESQIF